MNTYNESLQKTVIDTLSSLSLTQSQLQSSKTTVEYTLYHAQGAVVTAHKKLEGTRLDVTTWRNITDQSLINENQAFNLLASATDANADVTASITNVATAASNVQIASNAISALASDIGAALNITTASLFETDLYNKIQNSNSFINEVANEAKKIAKDAMKASGYTSEITSSEVLAQTTSLKSKIDGIFKSNQAELDKFSKLVIAETTQYEKDSQSERQAEGSLIDAQREVEAINDVYKNANGQLNQMLTVTVNSATQIGVCFSALPNPFPTFYSPGASVIPIPDAKPIYYLALLPAQNQTLFSIGQAEQLFEQRPPKDTSRFHEVSATPDVSKPLLVELTEDVYGDPIKAGDSYVAFLFIVLSKEYKQYVSNFSDLLSAPSQPFTPASTLPCPSELEVFNWSSPDAENVSWSSVQFSVAPILKMKDLEAAKEKAEVAETEAADAETAAVKAAADNLIASATATSSKSAYSAASIAANTAKAAADEATKKNSDAQSELKKAEAASQKAVEIAAVLDAEYVLAAQKAAEVPTPENEANAAAAMIKAEEANAAGAKAIAAKEKAETKANETAAAAKSAEAAYAKNEAAEKAAKEKYEKDEEAAEAADKKAKKAAVAANDAKQNAESAESIYGIYEALAEAKPEYRCILVDEKFMPDPDFMLFNAKNPPIYFNLAISEQVSSANYTLAKKNDQVNGGDDSVTYEVVFLPTTTDNFGNMIRPDGKYKPFILAVIADANADQYASALAMNLKAFVVAKKW